jgi:hypothetical protein
MPAYRRTTEKSESDMDQPTAENTLKQLGQLVGG